MYTDQITAATCRLDLFNSAHVIVTLYSRRSIKSPPPSLCPLPCLSAPSLCPLPARRCSVSHNQLKTLSWASDVRPSVFVHISVRSSLCLRPFISLSVRLSSVRLSSVRLSVRPSVIRPFFCPTVSLSIHPSVICPSLSVRLSVRPSLCPSVSLFVSVRPSITCPSLCCPCCSRSLSRA